MEESRLKERSASWAKEETDFFSTWLKGLFETGKGTVNLATVEDKIRERFQRMFESGYESRRQEFAAPVDRDTIRARAKEVVAARGCTGRSMEGPEGKMYVMLDDVVNNMRRMYVGAYMAGFRESIETGPERGGDSSAEFIALAAELGIRTNSKEGALNGIKTAFRAAMQRSAHGLAVNFFDPPAFVPAPRLTVAQRQLEVIEQLVKKQVKSELGGAAWGESVGETLSEKLTRIIGSLQRDRDCQTGVAKAGGAEVDRLREVITGLKNEVADLTMFKKESFELKQENVGLKKKVDAMVQAACRAVPDASVTCSPEEYVSNAFRMLCDRISRMLDRADAARDKIDSLKAHNASLEGKLKSASEVNRQATAETAKAKDVPSDCMNCAWRALSHKEMDAAHATVVAYLGELEKIMAQLGCAGTPVHMASMLVGQLVAIGRFRGYVVGGEVPKGMIPLADLEQVMAAYARLEETETCKDRPLDLLKMILERGVTASDRLVSAEAEIRELKSKATRVVRPARRDPS